MPRRFRPKILIIIICCIAIFATGYVLLFSGKKSHESTVVKSIESSFPIQELVPHTVNPICQAKGQISRDSGFSSPVENRKSVTTNISITDLVPALVEIKLPTPKPDRDVASSVSEPETFHELIKLTFWLWGGTGINYQYYQQTLPTIEGNSSYQNIKAPTFFLRGGAQGEQHGFDLSYKDTPGETRSSETVMVKDGNYHWQTLSAEYLYRQDESPWNWRLGFQHQSMPFMELNPLSSIVTVRSNSLTLLTAGFERIFPLSRKARFEWMMRYQYPIMSGANNGSSFNVIPRFAFDGSVGGVYNLGTNARLGVYWYGQFHKYAFSHQDGTIYSAGDQTLFYSNFEVRLGFEL